jgi:hypothetical protein
MTTGRSGQGATSMTRFSEAILGGHRFAKCRLGGHWVATPENQGWFRPPPAHTGARIYSNLQSREVLRSSL